MKTALIITGDKVQDHEFIYPYYRLKEAGYEITVALDKGVPVMGYLGTKIPCDSDCKIISHEHKGIFEGNYVLNPDFAYGLIVIPGGAKCMEYLRQKKNILDFINLCNKRKVLIASICHGAQMLISAKIVKGRKISGYYSIKDDIENAGAEYVDAPVVVDGNLITSPHYKYLGEWMKKVLEVGNDKDVPPCTPTC